MDRYMGLKESFVFFFFNLRRVDILKYFNTDGKSEIGMNMVKIQGKKDNR